MILDNCGILSRQLSQNGGEALIHHLIAAEMQHGQTTTTAKQNGTHT